MAYSPYIYTVPISILWAGPISISSGILIHPIVWPQYTDHRRVQECVSDGSGRGWLGVAVAR